MPTRPTRPPARRLKPSLDVAYKHNFLDESRARSFRSSAEDLKLQQLFQIFNVFFESSAELLNFQRLFQRSAAFFEFSADVSKVQLKM
jgi:hypothetical protein